MRSHQEIFEALAAPFPDNEVRYRPKGNRQLAYITARMARRRLNEVLGPFRWNCDIEPAEHWVLCTITVTLDDGQVVARTAMGGYPDMPEMEDRVKGGDSDSFKRCCALYGIAEYLYDDPDHAQTTSGSGGQQSRGPTRNAGFQQPPRGGGQGQPESRSPTTGSGLFAYVCRLEEQHGLAQKTIVRRVDEMFGPTSRHNFPRTWRDWSQNQVSAALTWLASEYGGQQEEEERPPY
jgi:hypothetical protein